MTSFAPPHWRRIPEPARVLLHRAERNAGRRAHGPPALAGIEWGDQLLAVGGAERRSAEPPRRAAPTSGRKNLRSVPSPLQWDPSPDASRVPARLCMNPD